MPEKVNNTPKFGVVDYLKEMYPKPEKTVTYKKETFDCKWCGSAWISAKSKGQHERWCKENPNHRVKRTSNIPIIFPKKEENPLRLNLSKPKIYTIEDIREIDKIIGLTADQIAKFVRGEKKE